MSTYDMVFDRIGLRRRRRRRKGGRGKKRGGGGEEEVVEEEEEEEEGEEKGQRVQVYTDTKRDRVERVRMYGCID